VIYSESVSCHCGAECEVFLGWARYSDFAADPTSMPRKPAASMKCLSAAQSAWRLPRISIKAPKPERFPCGKFVFSSFRKVAIGDLLFFSIAGVRGPGSLIKRVTPRQRVWHAMRITRNILSLIVLVSSVSITLAQQVPDPRVADIVQNGKIRVGIGLANLVSSIKEPGTGELRGVAPDLARALAARIHVEFQPIEYNRPGLVLAGAKANAWDVAFLVLDPARANDADFSAPYMESDFTLLVPVGSAIRKFADADQSGIRIGVPRGDAVDLNLTRLAKNALLVRVDNQTAGGDLLRTGQIDAYAAPRPALLGLSSQIAGSHVLEDSFATISFAAFVPKGHDEHAAYVGEFLEDAKGSGLIKSFIEAAGLHGIKVAPAAKLK
jgi:polar amino acid transport system substrate-binding protein